MPDQPEPSRGLISRLMWDDDNPVTITGRKARTRQVGNATVIARAATRITHSRFDEHGNLIARHVRRIRRVS